LLLAVIPIIITVRRIGLMEAPQRMVYIVTAICILMSIHPGSRVAAALFFSTQRTSKGIAIVPFWAGALTLMPALALLGTIAVLWKEDRAGISNPHRWERGEGHGRGHICQRFEEGAADDAERAVFRGSLLVYPRKPALSASSAPRCTMPAAISA